MTTANIAMPANHPNIFAIPFAAAATGVVGVITGRLEENSIDLPRVSAGRLVRQ